VTDGNPEASVSAVSGLSPRSRWLLHAGGIVAVLGVYLWAVYRNGTAYQSSRLVNPVRVGPNVFLVDQGAVYRGQRVGWCLTNLAAHPGLFYPDGSVMETT
jgi:hypothetical protein